MYVNVKFLILKSLMPFGENGDVFPLQVKTGESISLSKPRTLLQSAFSVRRYSFPEFSRYWEKFCWPDVWVACMVCLSGASGSGYHTGQILRCWPGEGNEGPDADIQLNSFT